MKEYMHFSINPSIRDKDIQTISISIKNVRVYILALR